MFTQNRPRPRTGRRTQFIAMSSAAGMLLGVLALGRPGTHPATAVSRAALLDTFESDLRNVVYRWAPDDPGSAAEKRTALFDFIYQTYDSSAWIPQSLFDGNLATQAIVGDVNTIVRDKVGLVLWRDNARVPAFGMAPNATPGEPLK